MLLLLIDGLWQEGVMGVHLRITVHKTGYGSNELILCTLMCLATCEHLLSPHTYLLYS